MLYYFISQLLVFETYKRFNENIFIYADMKDE